MSWHGYVVWHITTPLTANTVDEDGNVTEVGTRSLAKQALKELGRQSGPAHEITVMRPSNDKQSVLIRLMTQNEPTAAQFYNKLAELLPYTAGSIAAKSTFLVSPGATKEERRQATLAWMRVHNAEWEPNNG